MYIVYWMLFIMTMNDSESWDFVNLAVFHLLFDWNNCTVTTTVCTIVKVYYIIPGMGPPQNAAFMKFVVI